MKEFNLKDYKHIHFIGIGGVSMHLLALYCKDLGIEVSGSDTVNNKHVKICKQQGIDVHIGHRRKNIAGADVVVYTSAVDVHNIELCQAIKNKINVFERADFIAYICKNYKCVIGIAGTHGKTTTCAMVYHILRESGKNVSCHIGADVLGARLKPTDEYLVLECCEYNRSFLRFDCDVAVVLNVDNDHLDCYQNMYNLRNAFRTFLKRADNRFVFDNPTTKFIKNKINRISKPEITAFNKFSYCGDDYVLNNAFGEHNINNATVAVGVCRYIGVPHYKISKAIKTFMPAGRRCQKLGKIGKVDVITDYAHHPSEIKCLYDSLKLKYNNIYMVFQPHTYSRTKILFNDFVELFKGVDNLLIYKEYPAREHRSKGYDSKFLHQNIPNSIYIKNFKQLKDWCKGDGFEGADCVAFVGAGDINEIGLKLIDKTKSK